VSLHNLDRIDSFQAMLSRLRTYLREEKSRTAVAEEKRNKQKHTLTHIKHTKTHQIDRHDSLQATLSGLRTSLREEESRTAVAEEERDKHADGIAEERGMYHWCVCFLFVIHITAHDLRRKHNMV
jgi:hypothetical protein